MLKLLEGSLAFYVYLMASAPYGTLYCGHTDGLTRRVREHKTDARKGFTAKYGVHRLVWFEMHDSRSSAFVRERRIKQWRRRWKIELIEATNPNWDDLYDELLGP